MPGEPAFCDWQTATHSVDLERCKAVIDDYRDAGQNPLVNKVNRLVVALVRSMAISDCPRRIGLLQQRRQTVRIDDDVTIDFAYELGTARRLGFLPCWPHVLLDNAQLFAHGVVGETTEGWMDCSYDVR